MSNIKENLETGLTRQNNLRMLGTAKTSSKHKITPANQKIKPILKWAGGKYSCLHQIIPLFAEGKRLIEPFLGSGSIYLNTDYSNYILADSNPDLIGLFICLKTEGETFVNACKILFCAENNNEQQYNKLRLEFNACADTRRRAALFLYLNRHGYNGLCRYNLKGGYNVPFGRHKEPYFPESEMYYFCQKSHAAQFIHSNFRDTFTLATTGDVIYCDPPYVPLSGTANFTSYMGKQFTEQNQIDLATLAHNAAKRGINVLVSNHDTPFIRELYDGSEITSFLARRSISCKPGERKPVREVLAQFKASSIN